MKANAEFVKRMLASFALSAIFAFAIPFQAEGATACPGDVNGDGKVTIDELVTATSCILNEPPYGLCALGTVADLVAAVYRALYGCDIIWMTKVACRSCEPCDESIQSGLRVPRELAAAGIFVIDFGIEPGLLLCCGCPSLSYRVLVLGGSRDTLIAQGWR